MFVFDCSGGYAEEDNESQEEELEETENQFVEQNREKQSEEENERKDYETESENEDANSDEENAQTPETTAPVTRSKSKNKNVKNTCNKCLRNFRTPATLKRHKLNHCKGDNKKQHKCSHCDKSFTQLSRLKVRVYI